MSRWSWSLAVLSLLVVGCGGGDRSGPPQILYGEDVCDRCRMVISEERHAAAARVDGREHRFDDPGCLLAFAAAQPGEPVATVWVHDEASSWRLAEEAWFVRDPEGRTPMASGILAFGSAEAAAAAGRRLGGEPQSWREIAE